MTLTLIDLAGPVTPPGGSARAVVVLVEREGAAGRNVTVAQLVELVGVEAADAFARKVAEGTP